MEQSEGSPTKKSKKVLTVRTEMCDVSVRKAVQKREGKRLPSLCYSMSFLLYLPDDPPKGRPDISS
eukprot:5022310-Pyramimonas_sp.AAC.1